MLKTGRKSKFIIFVFICSYCTINRNEEIKERFEKLPDFLSYKHVYDLANDSLRAWKKDSLLITKAIFFDDYWQLDSLFCFNKKGTRFFSVINESNKSFMNAKGDNIAEFAGAKVNGRWCFFFMHVSTVVDRVSYQDSMYAPLTFSELSQIAHELIYPNYKIGKDGKAYASDAFFKAIFKTPDCDDISDFDACIDSSVLEVVHQMHQQKLDKAEIEEIKKEMAESVRPPEPPKKIMLWWEILIGREEKKKRFE